MESDGIFDTGTATVAANGTVITFQNAGSLADLQTGDRFGGHVGLNQRISEVGPGNGLTAAQVRLAFPWKGPAQTAAPYEITYKPASSGFRQSIKDLIDKYGDGILPILAALDGTGGNRLPRLTGPATADTVNLAPFVASLLPLENAAAFVQAVSAVYRNGQTVDLGGTGKGVGRIRLKNADQPPDTGARGLEIVQSTVGYLWQYENLDLQFATNNAVRMIIEASGDVTIARRLKVTNQPTAVLPGPPSAFSTASSVIPFGTPLVNVGGHWSTSLNRFTAPVAGNYLVMFCTEIDRDGFTGSAHIQQIRRNGSARHAMYMTRGTGSAYGRYIMQSLHAVVPCAANDFIDLYNSAGYVEANTYSNLSITLLN